MFVGSVQVAEAGMSWVAVGQLFVGAVTLVVIAIAAFYARQQIQKTREREKINNSFHHIAIQTRDHDLIAMFEEFREVRAKLRDGGSGSLGLDRVEGQEVSFHRAMLSAEDVIKKVFNYYEATAIGMHQDALDKAIIKDWWRRSYVLDFSDFALYVYEKRLRDKAPKLYLEYEKIVLEWAQPNEEQMILAAKAHAATLHPA